MACYGDSFTLLFTVVIIKCLNITLWNLEIIESEGTLLSAYIMLVSCLSYSSTQMTEEVRIEMPSYFHQAVYCYISEARSLNFLPTTLE
jgi:hypothetical protein